MSDDDEPQLSAHALAALKEFYAEQNISTETSQNAMPKENWQLSQFWYDDRTSSTLANEVFASTKPGDRIACISCPTLYVKLKELRPECNAIILEFDRQFERYGEQFTFYDFNNPLELPADFQCAFDLVIADPPFLSDECLTKTSTTIKHMAKKNILLCTGAVMIDKAKELLGVTPCAFLPKHANNLANEFRCYSNFTCTHLCKSR